MNGQKKLIFGITINILIFVLVAFSTWAMITGFNFMSQTFAFSAAGYMAFIYFTVDSNVYAGIISLVFAILQILFVTKKINFIPKWAYVLKLTATVSLTLTMMTTVCFLAPTSSRGYFALFMNSNFFFHFFIPVLCFISFCFIDNDLQLSFPYTITGIIPMFIYALFYTANVIIHMENGVIKQGTDWYGFLFMGFNSIYIVVPIILALTYLFSLGTWFIAKKCSQKD